MRAAAMFAASLWVAVAASAQTDAPSGPAEVFERARAERDAPELPADHPPVPRDHPPIPQGHPELDERSVQLALSGAPVARAEVDPELPAGTVVVHVVDRAGEPVAEQRVRLGVMRADGGRSEREATTGPDGVARFLDLPTGNEQSYRPSIAFDGARVAATPFRIEPDRGFRVELRRLPITRDRRYLLQALASTQIEFRQPGRVRVTQGAQLLNPTTHIFVFPEGGHAVELPEGAMAFQSRASMGDQRVVPTDDGFRIEGSVPPGDHELVWAYDLPLDGSALELEMPVAFRSTMGHRVVIDHVEGMGVEVQDMPGAFSHTLGGKRHVVVERRMRASEPPIETLRVRLTQIPSEGPARTVAVSIAALLALLGVASFLRSRGAGGPRAEPARRATVAALVDEIRGLDRDRAAGAIGPEYHRRERERAVAELAEWID